MKLFDTHCDTAVRCYNNFKKDGTKTPLRDNNFHISLKQADEMEQYTQLFAIWDDDSMEPDEGFSFFQAVYENFLEEVRKNSSQMGLCKTADELAAKQVTALLTVENGKLLGGDLDRLAYLYDCGVRLMTLVWNGSNCIGNGVFAEDTAGLTGFGREAVRAMNKMGMVVDVSHLNDAGFYDVARAVDAPFIASHSNSRSVCGHPRNLMDEQIKIICQSGGLIGLNFGEKFIADKTENTYEQLMRHIYHILDLGGENALCFGADFDGTDVPPALNGLMTMENLYDYMKNTDLGAALTDKIFYENAFQYFKNVLY